MKRNSVLFGVGLVLALSSSGAAQQFAQGDEVNPRIRRLERWLDATAAHRPGALDDGVRLIGSWNQEDLWTVWADVLAIVSLLREPDVSIFYVSEPARPGQVTRQISPVATNRSRQVLYTVGELRRLRAIAKQLSTGASPGPANDILKRGAMLHADVEMLVGRRGGQGNLDRRGPAGATLLFDDGQQLGLTNTVSHWNMGRRLLESVRPAESKAPFRRPDPAADPTVRQWYLAGCAYMLRTRFIEIDQFNRALELFPNDPDVLFFVASVHEYFAGVRTQSVMRSVKGPRDVNFDIQDEGAELRLAEQLYKRALDRSPRFIEARIRLGRVLGVRGRHEEAVVQLRQGQEAGEPLLQFYTHLFLGSEFEALGNGAEARQSYERAAALVPTAQSPLLGLSRVADQAGDRAAARNAVARVLQLPFQNEAGADPWWSYEIVQARGVDGLLNDLRQRIVALPR